MGLPVEINPLLISSSGYVVGRSLRFRSSASAYLNRTPASAGNRKTWTWSGWVKRGSLGSAQTVFGASAVSPTNDSNLTGFSFDAGDTFSFGGGATTFITTTQVFRDPSAWYHIVVALDTTQATASNRVKMYVNGVQVTAFSTSNYTTLNLDTAVNSAVQHDLASLLPFGGRYFDGYLAEVNFIDGQALTPSSFGAYDTNGVWQPLKYGGTYGTNGFYLPFSNTTSTTTLVQDSSGNGNNWTANNISLTAGTTYDSMIDSPTNSASSSNYAVGNPLNADGSTWSSGNLNFSLPNGTGNAQATFAVSSGKWYWEVVYSAQPNYTGVQQTGLTTRFTNGVLYGSAGDKSVNGTTSAYGATYTNGDIIGVALDMDGSTVTFYKNNVSQGSISLSGVGITNATFSLSAGGGTTSTGSVNFGQRPFTYTPPTGYSALNTYNLPAATIKNGAQYMAATLWTGNGTSQSIANSQSNGGNNALGVTFQPDFVWYKGRSTIFNHALFDVTRGALQRLSSNLTSAETATAGSLTAFNSNGFSIGNDAGANQNTDTYVGWQWKAGGTGVSNTSGSITSTVSANTTAGFSVVTWTGNGTNGATVGHGLGVTPAMVFVKNRSAAGSWIGWHTAISQAIQTSSTIQLTGYTGAIFLNLTNGSQTYAFDSQINGNTNNMVAYCFAAIRGYSAFGSYTGNGSSDGPFVFTNFRPRFVLIKDTAAIADWNINDSSRDTYNQMAATLFADSSSAESSQTAIDFLSNGFKIRGSTGQKNSSGTTYIYAAFAENPFNSSRAR